MYISADEREKDLLNPIIQKIHEIYEDPRVMELNLFLTGVAAFNNDSAMTLCHILTHEKPSHLTLSTVSYCTMAVPEMAIVCTGDRRYVRPEANIRLAVKYPSKYFNREPDETEREKAEEYRESPGFHDQERLLDLINQHIEVKEYANRLFTGKDLMKWGVLTNLGLDAELQKMNCV